MPGRAPSLHGHYSASTLLRAPPTPDPSRPTVMHSRRPLTHLCHSVGSPRFLLVRSTRAAPNHPGEHDRCTCSLLPGRWQASPVWAGWPLSLCVTRPNRVQYLRLKPSPHEAPHDRSLRRTLIRLLGERAIPKVSSFHLTQTNRLRLAHPHPPKMTRIRATYCLSETYFFGVAR